MFHYRMQPKQFKGHDNCWSNMAFSKNLQQFTKKILVEYNEQLEKKQNILQRKHIQVRHSHVIDEIDLENINIVHVPSEELCADFLTKSTGPKDFKTALKSLQYSKPAKPYYAKVLWIQKRGFKKGRSQWRKDDNDGAREVERYLVIDDPV